MKKRVLLILLFIFIILFSFAYIRLNDSEMRFLPKDKLIATYFSPNNDYQLDVYLSGRGATVAYSITVDVRDINQNIKKTIYYCYREKYAEIEWISNDIVSINGRKLDVRYDRYNSKWDKK